MVQILESLVVNQTAKTFDFVDCVIQGDADTRSFCQTSTHVFNVNTSLKSFCLPPMDFNAESGLMGVFVGGLGYSRLSKTSISPIVLLTEQH
jgi:hypothetical protein